MITKQIKPSDCIFVDEEGKFIFNEKLLSDEQVKAVLKDLDFSTKQIKSKDSFILPYDCVFVAQQVKLYNDGILITNYHGIDTEIILDEIYIDPFDRFVGLSKDNIPYVIGGKAQDIFFTLLDSYSDESIELNSKTYTTNNFFEDNKDTFISNYWSAKFTAPEPPGFELNHYHPFLESILAQLKLPRSRIAVLGCGSGNDAAYFASQGHIVTGFDFSEQAIERARNKYPESENLNFVLNNVFQLSEEYLQSFDIVFDHTFYCALDPEKRASIVKLWHSLLQPGGKLMGIFFSRFKPNGPPFGGSEFELERRIKKFFRPLYWNRMFLGPDDRIGTEYFVYAEKI